MFDIAPLQIVIVLAIALLVFGPRRLPELGRNLGRGIRDFKSGISGDEPAAEAPGRDDAPGPAHAPGAEEPLEESARPNPAGAAS